MPVKLEDRPIETVRSEVIDQLIMNYSHGELSYDAFERRLDSAMELQNPQDLVELTTDLPLTVDKAFVESKKQDLSPNYAPGETEDVDTMVNIFSSSNRGGTFKVAKEIRYFSFFSSTDIDFTDAQFSQREVRVKIFSMFSSDTIYVPENINVASKAFCIFGNIDNSAPNNSVNHGSALTTPTIIIEGFSLFSSIDIDLKRSLKEKFVNFADQLKKIFS
jgi:hypothetical protein